MCNSLGRIWNDRTLLGNFLTELPTKLWSFTTSDKLYTYTQPDPGTARKVYCIFEEYVKTNHRPNGTVENVRVGSNILPLKYLESGLRKLCGFLSTATISLTAAPIGFALKVINFSGRELSRRCGGEVV
jgi:hypothetical protein